MGVGALYKAGLVEWMSTQTYQAASGGGAQHMRELLTQFGALHAAAAGSLVGLRIHPFDQPGLEERAHAHQHAADGAVAADPVLAALGQGALDDGHVHRVQHDDGIAFHAQGAGGVNPVALPARAAQFGEDFVGVVAALASQDDVALLQRLDVARVFQRFLVFCLGGSRAACVARGEENGLDQFEIAFRLHAVHQHGADHAAPADQANNVTDFHICCAFPFR